MAKSPDTTPSNWSVRATYNYKYPGWTEQNPFISAIFQAAEKEATEKNQQEIARLDKADEIVQNMLTFPEAEAILNKIKETK